MTQVDKNKEMHILVLEPYYGGSHKSFLSGLSTLPFAFECITFPARKWKWRMRLSAPYYAQQLHRSGKKFDRILCSTFVDVAAFRGLAPSWVQNVPLLTYFHENQFAYPVQSDDERDFHFALTNMTTALASDSLAFNSAYNLQSFLQGIEKLVKKSYDLKLEDPCKSIETKSRVLPPGIDYSAIDDAPAAKKDVPVVVWNHRWEHDKNPELFFKALFELDSQGIEFNLIVLGESFKDHPPVFKDAAKKLARRTIHFGYAKSQSGYAELLKQGDIVVSTSRHEFFGIAVIEAVRAGCRPLLPKRLSYPELFPPQFLYEERECTSRLKELILNGNRLSPEESLHLTERFSLDSLAPVYTEWIRQ